MALLPVITVAFSKTKTVTCAMQVSFKCQLTNATYLLAVTLYLTNYLLAVTLYLTTYLLAVTYIIPQLIY